MSVKYKGYLTVIAIVLLLAGLYLVYRPLPVLRHTGAKNNDLAGSWHAPDTGSLSFSGPDNLIRYGRALIENTAAFLGPKGSVAPVCNKMNCQNCHLDAGTRLYGSNFALVANTYPKFRERSGRLESIEFRINECLQRSLNGNKIDSLSTEMRAMVAYIKWVGKDLLKGKKPAGTEMEDLSYLKRAADTAGGRLVYLNKCRVCHGKNGEGQPMPDSISYRYPPLWGPNSFNVSAGMYRISRMAAFVKHNMPYMLVADAPRLTDEEAWDVSAFINSQARPQKFFHFDWPNISSKPVDYPFGPFTDGFTAFQHKYGPFEEIKKAKSKAQKKSQ